MMSSPEKVAAMLELLQDEEDTELAQAIPIGLPVSMVRTGLMMIGEKIPRDRSELDRFLSAVGNFCHALRSDDAGGQPLDGGAIELPLGQLAE
jgi:hypothetical protein